MNKPISQNLVFTNSIVLNNTILVNYTKHIPIFLLIAFLIFETKYMYGQEQTTVVLGLTDVVGTVTGTNKSAGAQSTTQINWFSSATDNQFKRTYYKIPLTGIPSGSTITKVECSFRVSEVGTGSGNGHEVRLKSMGTTDPNAASGTVIRDAIRNGTIISETNWGTTTGWKDMTLNQSGVSYFQSRYSESISLNRWAAIGLEKAGNSEREISIHGNSASSSNRPKCVITYNLAGCVTPDIQSSNIGVSNIDGVSATISWTIGNGNGRVVYIRKGSSTISKPANGSNPTASVYLSGGDEQQCVFNGAGGGPVTIIGLEAGATYYIRIFEYCLPERRYGDFSVGNTFSFTMPTATNLHGYNNDKPNIMLSDNTINIENGIDDNSFELLIYDSKGSIVMKSNNRKTDIRNIQRGIYFITLITKKETISKKISVQ